MTRTEAVPEGRRRLLRAARRGDRGARDRLVAHELGLVRTIASRYRDLGLPFDDLVQEGSIGLLEAIDRYDPERGSEFDAFARFRVRRAIRNALDDQARLIRLPKQVVEQRRALDRAEARLCAAGQQPTPEALAAATGLPLHTVLEARCAAISTVSLDAPTLPDGSPLHSVVADPAARDPVAEAIARERRSLLRAALAGLSDRKRYVVASQWGLAGAHALRGRELASELRLSSRRTQAIGREALDDLRGDLERVDAASPTR